MAGATYSGSGPVCCLSWFQSCPRI
jgi:hypothetical protein